VGPGHELILDTNGVQELSPALSADGLVLYFESDAIGTAGGLDIFVTTRPTTSDPFGPAAASLPNVNSVDGERNPSITANGNTLYLSSELVFASFFDLYIVTRGCM
jgi:hypothetical protein